jgi:predicted amidohydrolase YtcJ
VGKWADVVILSQDLLEVAEPAIRDTEVVTTILGGRVVYRAGDPR